jgi:pre-mRNA-splicing factor CWC22
VFEYIKLNEDETTSSSRIFIKILCQELSEGMGIRKLKERFSEDSMQGWFAGIFPRNSPRDTRFAINFFTSIQLGALTDGLRAHLANLPKLIKAQEEAAALAASSSDSDSSSSSSSSSSSDSDDSSSDSDSDSSSRLKCTLPWSWLGLFVLSCLVLS